MTAEDMSLTPKDNDLLQYMKTINLAMRFLEADSQKSHPNIDFTLSEWTIKNGIPMPTFAADYPTLPELYNIFNCTCN